MFLKFLGHLFPRVVLKRNLRLSYTFCFGGLALSALFVLTLSGILLMFYYQPHSSRAYESILFLEESVSGGRYLRNLHRLTSHTLLVLLFLHTLRVILTGAYRAPREMNWVIGFCLLCLAIFSAYTGYLLPMDQLALWATQTGMNLVETIPGGQWVSRLLMPDGLGGSLTLLRFYVLHIAVVPVVMTILCQLHFYQIRRNKGLMPYL